ncbi:hypothetical protein BC938DRAFT_483417 [Jimgerdemannia flammicorona]|uniref:PH domain-containing protein n=1 Tax=Jimgerdemannia flammicorona TaxID=994334 RepID=A0A433QC24_9FUNG|nr:hypothetical protein BC938DRAFT_483417 [Jimgerdemannia flammicorona]
MSEVVAEKIANESEAVVSEAIVTKTTTTTTTTVITEGDVVIEQTSDAVVAESEVVKDIEETAAVATTTTVEETTVGIEEKEEEEELQNIENGGILKKKGGTFGTFGRSPDRYFYFTDEAYSLNKLKNVHKKHTALVSKGKGKDDHEEIFQAIAHATHTGKGLLFYTTSAKHTEEPHGIIVLKHITNVDLVPGGKVGYHPFHIVTQHHTWELAAKTEKEAKQWVQTINSKREEAKSLESVEETETYKITYDKLGTYSRRFDL